MTHEASFLSALLGLVFVLGLIFLLSYLVKRFGAPFLSGHLEQRKKTTLTLLEIRQIDPKNRLVLLRCKNKEYLIAAGETHLLIDSFPVIPDNDTTDQAGKND